MTPPANPDQAASTGSKTKMEYRENRLLGRFLRHEISREEAVAAVGIDRVELAERQHQAMLEDIEWGLRG